MKAMTARQFCQRGCHAADETNITVWSWMASILPSALYIDQVDTRYLVNKQDNLFVAYWSSVW